MMKNILRTVVGGTLVLAGFIGILFIIALASILMESIPSGVGNVLYDIFTWAMIIMSFGIGLFLVGVLGYEVGCKIFK